MFIATMEAVVAEEIAPSTPVWSIWNRLANRGELPQLAGPVPPHQTGSTWWGWLPDGIFFVTDMRMTDSGFSCRITLHPRPKKDQDTHDPGLAFTYRSLGLHRPKKDQDTHEESLVFWLAKNLFRGRARIEQDPLTYHYTFNGEGVSFTLKYWTQFGFDM